MAMHNPLPIRQGAQQRFKGPDGSAAVAHPRGRWASKRLHRAW